MLKDRIYVFEKTYALPRKKVWELLSNTEHLNRVSGLFSVHFSPAQFLDDAMFRWAEAKTFGIIPLKWKEFPFEWVKEEIYSIERVYVKGPIKRLLWSIECADHPVDDGTMGTKVIGIAKFTPASLAGYAAIPIAGVPPVRKIMNYVDLYLATPKNSTAEQLPQMTKSFQVDQDRLFRICEELAEEGFNIHLVERLKDHLLLYGDDEVLQMKPYALAEKWNEDREQVLALCLHATKKGLLIQSWSLMCPNCRVPKVTVSTLSSVTSQVHCDLCGIDFKTNFDQYIEMRFSVHPAVRKAADQTYCMGGPMTSPHITAQHRIKPSDQKKIRIPPFQKEMRLRVLKHNHIVYHREDCGSSVVFGPGGWDKNCIDFPDQGGFLEIRNSTEKEITIVFEETVWDEQAATAQMVTSQQLFRDLFSKEVLSPDQQIGIESLTVLFSDLQGSTSLYQNIGDAMAYRQVDEHFAYLKQHISKNRGAVIKTIGDSVMAVFNRSDDALSAALAIQAGIRTYNKEKNTSLSIKLGLFTGPTIAVNANDLLDYFGHTVNLAARIQQQSEGNDIVISRNAWKLLSPFVSPFRYESSQVNTQLNGIEEEITLIQLKNITYAGDAKARQLQAAGRK
ncbi:adenylate/guanylate cyclase domain-containing protein [Jeotgalibacillus sp. ET6]|uniref:adenylate/guanylate cyclase domain-containing protein n=1 Tax=Jeotgalibacillus sp. ET6 TaxID=3037260 RepID=UPI0024184C3F|nr:adenylate/guanylate cyclase domain-containing protein [Jeotgalibacillus sp. ET6]MDG5471918.1 adenylate/guanylate cyclase domain-containing protein [Jeotgalibacillus sp. ET6]